MSALSLRNYEKNNTWNIRRLVDDSFGPSSQRTRVLHCKLTDFWKQVTLEPCAQWLHLKAKIVLPFPNHQIRLQNGFDPKVNPQLCALHASSHYSKRWPFSASVNRISMRQFSVTLFIIHPPKKTRQLKLLLIAQRAVKKDVSILEFQDIPILSTG